MPYLDNIHYTTHALERIDERGISLRDVEATLRYGEVIEEYKTDEEARYLMHRSPVVESGSVPEEVDVELHFHVVAADQFPGRTVVITAYDPSKQPERWSDDYKRRID